MPATGPGQILVGVPARPVRLIRSSAVATGLRDWPDWFADAHAEFRATLLAAAGYPCDFGVSSERTDQNWFTALDERQPGLGTAELAETLADFVPLARSGPPRQSLVVLVGPPRRYPELAQHAAQFWAVLRQLTRQDRQPWPARYPLDPTSPDWRWCFAGQPWSVFGASPDYRHRRSRNLGRCLTIVFQLAGRVYEGLAGSPAGTAAKQRIRSRLGQYDLVGPHPHLGLIEQPVSYRWRRYFLPDDNRDVDEQACPWTAPSAWTRPPRLEVAR
ncbi:MAG TPA: YqcI/YcgG family protein [Jatrophihabitans sp.]|nr:YqcI/YcgG family protein [Jatrophihabitans sp.]